MKTSTNTLSIANIVGHEKSIELVAKAGFDAWSFDLFDIAYYDYANKRVLCPPHPLNSPNYASYCYKLKRIGLDNGITCNQTHAPFPICVKEIKDTIKRAIECSAEVGADICVVHPNNDGTAEENAEFYLSILPFPKEHNVRIATENMYNWGETHSIPAACSSPEDFCKHIDLVNDKSLVACLDIGHAEMFGVNTSAKEMIYALKDRLQSLHIHDNNKIYDNHQLPYTMNIDFLPIAKALKDINYQGYLTLEATTHMYTFNNSDIETGIKHLYDSIKRFDEEIKNA